MASSPAGYEPMGAKGMYESLIHSTVTLGQSRFIRHVTFITPPIMKGTKPEVISLRVDH